MRINDVLRRLAVAVALIGVVPAAIVLRWRERTDRRPADQLHRLLELQHGTRRFEPRLGGEQSYRPVEHTRSGTTSLPDLEEWTAIGRLEQFAQVLGGEGGHASAALGLSRLYRGDLDSAVELLRDAVYLNPDEASYWCDLAAVDLVRGRPTDLLEALNSSETALHLRPALEDAVFDRALALERVGLLDTARSAWRDLTQTAKAPGWILEARSHLARIDEWHQNIAIDLTADDLLHADPNRLTIFAERALDGMRRVVENELMPKLGVVCADAESTQCEELLQKTRSVAIAMTEASPDRQLAVLAEQLKRWGAAGLRDPSRADTLVSYGAAMRLYEQDQVTESASLFARLASQSGERIASVYPNAVLYTCLDDYFRAEHARARRCLDRLGTTAARSRFTFLLGRIDWLRAQISLAEGNLGRASGEFDRAIAWLKQARDRNQAAAVESLRATLLDQLGSLDEAWRDRIGALTRAHLEPRRRHTTLNSATRSCLLQHFPFAALDFQEAAVQHAIEWGQPGALVESYLNRAVTFERLGRPREARSDLDSARRRFDDVADGRARSRFEGELPVMEGEVLAESSPAEALPILERAALTLTSMQFDLLRARVDYATGVAAERLGEMRRAASAYRRAVDVIEHQREPLSSAAHMQSIEVVWDMYEHLIARRLEDEGSPSAFITVEASRAQALQRFLPKGADDLPALTDISRLLPSHTILLYFAVLENETVRWTISNAGVDVVRMPVGRHRLEYLVRRLRRAVNDPAWRTVLRQASEPLCNVLLPRQHPIQSGTTLFIVPDGPLNDLPVAVLVNPATDRHLIEDHAIGVAPSLRLFLAASRAARERFNALDAALIVKGRTADVPGRPQLSVLPSADDEIRFVVETYGRSRLLAGAEATPAEFIAQAGAYPVVHFTGHAVADRSVPELSRLYLEPSGADQTGWLLIRDLESATFARTALVVLAACDTGSGRVFRGEGVMSLARPFLGKGVAAVVNTLWEVADAPSARLLRTFHAGVRSGLEPVVALQRAQRHEIEHPETPEDIRTWPAFQYVGGVRP